MKEEKEEENNIKRIDNTGIKVKLRGSSQIIYRDRSKSKLLGVSSVVLWTSLASA